MIDITHIYISNFIHSLMHTYVHISITYTEKYIIHPLMGETKSCEQYAWHIIYYMLIEVTFKFIRMYFTLQDFFFLFMLICVIPPHLLFRWAFHIHFPSLFLLVLSSRVSKLNDILQTSLWWSFFFSVCFSFFIIFVASHCGGRLLSNK